MMFHSAVCEGAPIGRNAPRDIAEDIFAVRFFVPIECIAQVHRARLGLGVTSSQVIRDDLRTGGGFSEVQFHIIAGCPSDLV